ncbi:hypothetical protein BgiMline_033236, partial [Biomphalaria glabrata]
QKDRKDECYSMAIDRCPGTQDEPLFNYVYNDSITLYAKFCVNSVNQTANISLV